MNVRRTSRFQWVLVGGGGCTQGSGTRIPTLIRKARDSLSHLAVACALPHSQLSTSRPLWRPESFGLKAQAGALNMSAHYFSALRVGDRVGVLDKKRKCRANAASLIVLINERSQDLTFSVGFGRGWGLYSG